MIHLFCTALVLTQVQTPPSPPPLSPFQRAKAAALLRDRLPCLGCHELGGDGGQIGPSLSELQRLQFRGPGAGSPGRPLRGSPEYVRAMIRDPQGTAPGTLMPKIPMPPATLELIATYLVQRDPTPPAARTAAPGPDAVDTASAAGAALYRRHCAACHGARGRADGYNAGLLPVRPTAHADSAYMSRRPDDALFDAIYGGGFIMNRSNRMPPFGETLSRGQIWDLVRYLRTLCHCQGPSWSRDGS